MCFWLFPHSIYIHSFNLAKERKKWSSCQYTFYWFTGPSWILFFWKRFYKRPSRVIWFSPQCRRFAFEHPYRFNPGEILPKLFRLMKTTWQQVCELSINVPACKLVVCNWFWFKFSTDLEWYLYPLVTVLFEMKRMKSKN